MVTRLLAARLRSEAEKVARPEAAAGTAWGTSKSPASRNGLRRRDKVSTERSSLPARALDMASPSRSGDRGGTGTGVIRLPADSSGPITAATDDGGSAAGR